MWLLRLCSQAVLLQFRLQGIQSSERRLLPLRRFLHLCRTRRFSRSLFPHNPQIARMVDMLRVHDALVQGASQREIGVALFGEQRVALDWTGPSDSLRSRVRRLVRDAGIMTRGGWRQLMRRKSSPPMWSARCGASCPLDTTYLVAKMNRVLRGWANYFSVGTTSRAYRAVDSYTVVRLRRWLRAKHKTRRKRGGAYHDPELYERFGLVRLANVAAARPG